MEEKDILFRDSLGGYNKSDVNKYIVKISEDFLVRERANTEALSHAERHAAEENEKRGKAERERDEIAFEAYTEKLRADAGEAKIVKLTQELERRDAMLDELACESYKTYLKVKELEENKQAVAAQNNIAKDAERIMESVKSGADVLIATAQEKCVEIIADANTEALKVVSEAKAEAEHIINNAKTKKSSEADDYKVRAEKLAEQIRSAIASFNGEKTDSVCATETGKKTDSRPAAESYTQSGKSNPDIESRIEAFFKNAIAAITAIKRKK